MTCINAECVEAEILAIQYSVYHCVKWLTPDNTPNFPVIVSLQTSQNETTAVTLSDESRRRAQKQTFLHTCHWWRHHSLTLKNYFNKVVVKPEFFSSEPIFQP